MQQSSIESTVASDSNGFRFVLQPCMLPYRKQMCDRACDQAIRTATMALIGDARTVFDVGAHAGRFSVFVARLPGFRGHIHAFEPVPATARSLVQNLALNDATCVTVHQLAICDRDGEATMNLFPEEFSSWNSLGSPNMTTPDGKRLAPRLQIPVSAARLDTFCLNRNIERIDFLKVDVEGFEHAVFGGASELMARGAIGRLCFEMSRDPLLGAGASTRQAFAALEAHGYSAWRFNPDRLRFEGPVQDSHESWTDFYAAREPLDRIDVNGAIAARRASATCAS